MIMKAFPVIPHAEGMVRTCIMSVIGRIQIGGGGAGGRSPGKSCGYRFPLKYWHGPHEKQLDSSLLAVYKG